MRAEGWSTGSGGEVSRRLLKDGGSMNGERGLHEVNGRLSGGYRRADYWNPFHRGHHSAMKSLMATERKVGAAV